MLLAGSAQQSEPQKTFIYMHRLNWPEGMSNTIKRMVLWVIDLGQHVMPHGFYTHMYISQTEKLFLDMCVGMHLMQKPHERHPCMHKWLHDGHLQPLVTCMSSLSCASDTGSTSFLTNLCNCLPARRRQACPALSESAWPVAANAE